MALLMSPGLTHSGLIELARYDFREFGEALCADQAFAGLLMDTQEKDSSRALFAENFKADAVAFQNLFTALTMPDKRSGPGKRRLKDDTRLDASAFSDIAELNVHVTSWLVSMPKMRTVCIDMARERCTRAKGAASTFAMNRDRFSAFFCLWLNQVDAGLFDDFQNGLKERVVTALEYMRAAPGLLIYVDSPMSATGEQDAVLKRFSALFDAAAQNYGDEEAEVDLTKGKQSKASSSTKKPSSNKKKAEETDASSDAKGAQHKLHKLSDTPYLITQLGALKDVLEAQALGKGAPGAETVFQTAERVANDKKLVEAAGEAFHATMAPFYRRQGVDSVRKSSIVNNMKAMLKLMTGGALGSNAKRFARQQKAAFIVMASDAFGQLDGEPRAADEGGVTGSALTRFSAKQLEMLHLAIESPDDTIRELEEADAAAPSEAGAKAAGAKAAGTKAGESASDGDDDADGPGEAACLRASAFDGHPFAHSLFECAAPVPPSGFP